jgi:VIT1/CCC1 family predicted Fe2+/Mn2+ transporter
MSKSHITYAQKLSGMLASLTAFLCSAIIFVKSSAITMSVLIHALMTVIPATVATGVLGHMIGKIFDSAKKKKSLNQFRR